MDAEGGGPGGVDTEEDRRVVRLTQAQASANVSAVLQLCGAGRLRGSEKTQRPAATTGSAGAGVLAGGGFFPAAPIAAVAWPLLPHARRPGGRRARPRPP